MTGRPDNLFGADDLDALFHDEAPLTVVPWQRVVRPLRSEDDRDRLRELLSEPPRADQFLDLDPRDLSASQPAITRAGVGYYLDADADYRRTGRTFADHFQPANKYPVVHRLGAEIVILSGHHRAAAALLTGRPLRARLIQADWTNESGAAVVVTPSLLAAGSTPALDHVACRDRWIAETIVNLEGTAWLMRGTDHDIRHLLRELAVDEPWLHHQLHFARTGRIRLPRREPITGHN